MSVQATPIYYDIFGVRDDATTDEIRAAYVRLLKQHHPDIASARGTGDARSDYAATLNAGFAILRDPSKRRAYDQEIARGWKATVVGGTPRRVVSGPRMRTAIRPKLAAVAVGIGTVVLATGLITGGDWANSRSSEYLGMDKPSGATQRPAALRFSRSELEPLIRAAIAVSPDRAVQVSTRCFRSSGEADDRQGTELCVIFDDAFLFWRPDAEASGGFPSYFGEEVVRARHLDKLAAAGDDAEEASNQLREFTLRTLVARIGATAVDPAVPDPRIVAREKQTLAPLRTTPPVP